MSSRGVTASTLTRQSNRPIIQSIVQDQMKIIDAKIITAHQAGFNCIEYELPVNFNINNVDKSDAQTLVYSEILKFYSDLETNGGKGFVNTYIDVRASKTILYINWINGMNDAERERRQQIIRNHILAKR